MFASVPRIWEKFVSAVEIKMADSTIIKRLMYRVALKTGLKWVRAADGSSQKTLLALAYWPLYYLVLFHLRRQLGFERIRYAVCGAAPGLAGAVRVVQNAIGVRPA